MAEQIQRGQRIGGGFKPWLAGLLALPMAVAAQTPSAGSLLQQAQPSVTAPPAPTQALPQIAAPRAVAPPLSGGPKVTVRGFRLAGIDAAQAAALTPHARGGRSPPPR